MIELARTKTLAEKVIKEAIDKPLLGMQADSRTITKLTGLDRSTVSKAIGRMIKKRDLTPRICLKPGTRDTEYATIVYQIPEFKKGIDLPFSSSPSIQAMRHRTRQDRQQEKEDKLILSILGPKLHWQRLVLTMETEHHLRSAEVRKWANRRNNDLPMALHGETRNQIVDQLASTIYKNGSVFNEKMKGEIIIPWDKKLIQTVVNDLLDRHLLRIKPSYVLETTAEFERENKRIIASMNNMYEQVIDDLRREGKWKTMPLVPTVQVKKAPRT